MTLSVEEFGRQLVVTGDLDPVYVVLHGAELPQRQLYRWLVAYWCLYHVGAASYISEREGIEFWALLMRAARNEEPAPDGGRWPRAAERRHFRGGAAVRAVLELRERYGDTPEKMVQHVSGFGRIPHLDPVITADEVISRVREHHLFGPWIAFKAADMIERLSIAPVDFETCSAIFDSPEQGAIEACEAWKITVIYGDAMTSEAAVREAKVAYALARLRNELSRLPAPPRNERPVNSQECETVLCKWHSHLAGRYEVGKDWRETHHALDGWALHSDTALRLINQVPQRISGVSL